ncbi:MAG: aspartyl protease family protein [Acidobacteriaceae bacterium]|nr:aspartyl protease family protein [Acidobacteriaceae bacterium]
MELCEDWLMKQSSALLSVVLLFAFACCVRSPVQGAAIEQSVIEVPFEFIHDSIVVQASVNEHGPFWMLLDTGADPSIVDLETANNVGLKLAAKGQQGSGGGTGVNPAYETVLPVVQLGGLRAANVDALGMNLSKLSSALGRPVGGVLGYSFLKRRIVQIDYPSRKVRFYTIAPSCTSDANSPVPNCTTLRFRYKDDILATGVTVNGKRVITNIDTGSNSYFQINPAAVDKLGLSGDLARAHASSSVGFNGELKNREGTVRNVTVGTISVNEPTVVFFGKGMGMDKEPWDLRIGNKFLKDYVVTLDFQRGRVTLAVP